MTTPAPDDPKLRAPYTLLTDPTRDFALIGKRDFLNSGERKRKFAMLLKNLRFIYSIYLLNAFVFDKSLTQII
jgi:hypothetical protein